jgi:hypothetical protein
MIQEYGSKLQQSLDELGWTKDQLHNEIQNLKLCNMTHQFENAATQEFADEQEYAKLLVEYYSRLETISPLLGKALTTGGALSKHIKNFVNPIDKELKIIETRMKIQHED